MKNLYKGVNPHLNSLLQTPGTDAQPEMWTAFHHTHINHIADFLNRDLPENYLVLSEKSLQKREIDHEDIEFEGDDSLTAAVIRVRDKQPAFGKVTIRIELLSPLNKPGGVYYSAYKSKRTEAIQTGVPLIEIDYLHETPSPIWGLPRYPADSGSYPYSISIADPRPNWQRGRVNVYSFNVNQPLPALSIPLSSDEASIFDFDAVYQHTFAAGRWGKFVDYHQLPARFETYSSADQARIRQQMDDIAAQS